MYTLSAGVGRTGTYLAIDYLLSEAICEGFVNVYKHVKDLRAQRMHCVQTLVIIGHSCCCYIMIGENWLQRLKLHVVLHVRYY